MTAPFIVGMDRHVRPRVYLAQGYRYYPLYVACHPVEDEILYSWGNCSAPAVVLAIDLLSLVSEGPIDDDGIEAFTRGIVATLPTPFCLTLSVARDWYERWAMKRLAPVHR